MALPSWIRRAKAAGLVGEDVHKIGEKKVAEMGGVIVLLSFLLGMLLFIAFQVFLLGEEGIITPLLSILVAVLVAGMIGIIDDILGWKIGLRQWQKPLLTLLVALPVMAVDAGVRVMSLPLLGAVDLGVFYVLLVIPVLLLLSTNGFNMLAGYNGLEAGQGILILGTLSYFAFVNQLGWLSMVAWCMLVPVFAFWLFNKFPARIFPGDSFTYTVGALIGAITIFADLEKIFLILFVPYIIEFFLKLRGRFKKESFAHLASGGALKLGNDGKWYCLTHIVISGLEWLKVKVTEQRVVLGVHFVQLLFIALAFIL